MENFVGNSTMKQFTVADLQRKDVFIYKVTLAFCSNFIIFIRLCVGASLGNCILTLKIWSCDKQMSVGE
ncbi:hypothetical protein T03_9975 [Trichinella britovi]|uniref:Uncharacterized protein n=1 Tax=Trichinella britovi TaxID=45882 RepID=A0A0V1D9Z1_TRIBR|nr:hypothetical protein T03_9975 [Trichinella britovi]